MRHTIRLLLKSPAFTITAVLILAVGIGANTAIFSLINSVLLKPLPYPRADRLVEIFQPLRNLQTFYVVTLITSIFAQLSARLPTSLRLLTKT